MALSRDVLKGDSPPHIVSLCEPAHNIPLWRKSKQVPKKPFLVGSVSGIKGVDTNEMPKMVLVLPWYTNLVYHFWYGISPKTPNIRPILAGIWYGTGILVKSGIWYFSYEDEVVFAD